jgi:O-methyltransferase.
MEIQDSLIANQTQSTISSAQVESVPPHSAFWNILMGGFAVQAVYVAAELKLADLLKSGAVSYKELAEQTATHAPSLHRLLRALASIGIFKEDEHQRFELTPLSQLLRSDSPGSLRAITLLVGSSFEWSAWSQLLHSIQTGESAFEHIFGMDLWAYTTQHPEAQHVFHHAMSGLSAQEVNALLSAYDFSTFHSIVDVAGGHGQLLTTLLHCYPLLHGVLFELPEVVREAQRHIEEAGLTSRCDMVAGNMFNSIPAGYDGYILKSIIHNWDDNRVIQLLQTCRIAMPDHAKLLLITRVLAPRNLPDNGKFMDLNMLVTLGGCERTKDELTTILADAHLHLTRIVPTRSPLSIIECMKC